MSPDRRQFLRIAGALTLGPVVAGAGCRAEAGRRGTSADSGSGPGGTGPTWDGYDDVVVVDALAGPIQFNIPQESLPLGEAALEQVRASGITAVNLTVNGRAEAAVSAYEATRARIAGWLQEIDRNPDVLSLARSVEDIQAAKRAGVLGLVLGFQDTVPFEDDLAGLDAFHESGLRIVQLTYNVQNRVGSGCLAASDDGLTGFGQDAVARLDELGILVDLSHCGPRTTLDGIQASSRPVSITHSGCDALFEHPRSKDDATLRLLAEAGGVVGIYLMPFLNASGPPTAADVVAHVEHAINVCGEDHVGIGSDQGIVPLDVSGEFPERFAEVSAQRAALGIAAPREDTIPYVPELNHPRRMETIGGLLAARGHPARVIEKVLGGNFMRLFGEVWA